MVADVKNFYSKIKNNSSLISKMDIIQDEEHISMIPAAAIKGLRFIVINNLEKITTINNS